MKITITSFSVHREGQHPIFDEQATQVKVVDDGGGPYLELSQTGETGDEQVLRLNFNEIGSIYLVCERLRSEFAGV